MNILKKPIKGLGRIRTNIDKSKSSDQSYIAFRRIACIEMERIRLSIEKKSGIRRLEQIDVRIQELRKEKEVLLKIANDSCANNDFAKDLIVKEAAGFKLKY